MEPDAMTTTYSAHVRLTADEQAMLTELTLDAYLTLSRARHARKESLQAFIRQQEAEETAAQDQYEEAMFSALVLVKARR